MIHTLGILSGDGLKCGSVPAVAYVVANSLSIVVIGRNSRSGCDGNGMKSCFR